VALHELAASRRRPISCTGPDMHHAARPRRTVPTLVPAAYLNSCSGCHGPTGAGSAQYPNIVNNHTLDTFTVAVRNGKAGPLGIHAAFRRGPSEQR